MEGKLIAALGYLGTFGTAWLMLGLLVGWKGLFERVPLLRTLFGYLLIAWSINIALDLCSDLDIFTSYEFFANARRAIARNVQALVIWGFLWQFLQAPKASEPPPKTIPLK